MLGKKKKVHNLKSIFFTSFPEKLNDILSSFNYNSALRVKELEAVTNHDVKAIEYYVKEKLVQSRFKKNSLIFFLISSSFQGSDGICALLLHIRRHK